MVSKVNIRQATSDDFPFLRKLLTDNGQKSTIQFTPTSIFYFAEYDAVAIGMVGAELSGTNALIRSAAVLSAWRKNGIATSLVRTLIDRLRGLGILRMYLFSRDAGSYWQKFGFTQCSVHEIISNLPDAPQVVAYVSDGSIWTDVVWKLDVNQEA